MLCDVTQSLKLQKSSKETAHCRSHPSRSFRTPRNENSQNMKLLSTPESPDKILLTFEAHELHTASFQVQKHTPSFHRSPGILLLVVLWFYPGLVARIALQPPSLLWSPFSTVCDIIHMKQSDWSATIVALGTKLNRQVTRLFFPSAHNK